MIYRLQSLGWALFMVSAVFFIIAAWRAGDMMALAGAMAFLAANVAFIFAHRRET